jgi:hypothetical protein
MVLLFRDSWHDQESVIWEMGEMKKGRIDSAPTWGDGDLV